MPELDQDPQDPQVSDPSEETLGNEDAGAEPAGEAKESKGPKSIPYDRFQEVWQERQDARQNVQGLQMQILQMQQHLANVQQNASQPKAPPIDPEIDQIVAPVVAQRTAHLEQQLRQLTNQFIQVQAKTEAESAWNYVLQYVPDMDELKDDLAREIEKKSPAIQKKITSDPDLVIELAEKVRVMRSSGLSGTARKTQADIKGRSRSESGGTGTNPSRTRQVDWASLSPEEFRAEHDRVLRMKSGGF